MGAKTIGEKKMTDYRLDNTTIEAIMDAALDKAIDNCQAQTDGKIFSRQLLRDISRVLCDCNDYLDSLHNNGDACKHCYLSEAAAQGLIHSYPHDDRSTCPIYYIDDDAPADDLLRIRDKLDKSQLDYLIDPEQRD